LKDNTKTLTDWWIDDKRFETWMTWKVWYKSIKEYFISDLLK